MEQIVQDVLPVSRVHVPVIVRVAPDEPPAQAHKHIRLSVRVSLDKVRRRGCKHDGHVQAVPIVQGGITCKTSQERVSIRLPPVRSHAEAAHIARGVPINQKHVRCAVRISLDEVACSGLEGDVVPPR